MCTGLTKRIFNLLLPFFAIIIAFDQNAIAQTRLGLHVTQQELDIWRQRAQSGPYKNAGDVSTNSPGDWNRIVSKANAFLANPPAHRWAGQTANSCVTPYQQFSPFGPSTQGYIDLGEPLMNAGFYYLITGDNRYRDAVLGELLWHATQPGLDFSNTSRWCRDGNSNDAPPYFHIAFWNVRLMFGYDYIRSSLSATDRNTLDTWFRNAGIYFESSQTRQRKEMFVDPNNDNYTLTSFASDFGGNDARLTHFNGYRGSFFHSRYTNRSSELAFHWTMAGALVDDPVLKERGKRWVKEWLKYSIFPDGTPAEFERWEPDLPTLGWIYSGTTLGNVVGIADVLCRAGDCELFNFSTTDGAFGTAGGPKTLRLAIEHYYKYVNNSMSPTRYATDSSSNNGNSDYRIDPVDEIGRQASVRDLYSVQANLFFRDDWLKSIYTRTASGAPNYPGDPEGGGYNAWGGGSGKFPALLFMFGQMEGHSYLTGDSQVSTITLTSTPETITGGQSATLNWSATNVTSCSASDGWTGTKAASGTENVTPTQTTTYTLTCSGSAGSSTQTTTVRVFTQSADGTIAINAGGGSYATSDGTAYEADIFSNGGTVYKTVNAISNTTSGDLYQTERFGNFSYAIPVVNGDYTLTLQFAEIYWDSPGQRLFDVLVEGVERLSNLDIYALAGKDTAYDITLPVKVNDGVLNLEFRTDIDNAKLSALKLTRATASPPSAPTGLNVSFVQ